MKKTATKDQPIFVPIWYGFDPLEQQEKFIMGLREAKVFLGKLSLGKIPNTPNINCKKLEILIRKMERDSIKEIKGFIIAQNDSGWFQVAIYNCDGCQYDILLVHDWCLKMATDYKVVKFATYCELKPDYFSPQPDAA